VAVPRRYEFLDHPGPIAFAHRGGASDAPENTLPAFQKAVDLGYRYLETDAQVTSDGVVVAFHDDDLFRATGVRGRISELPWSAVGKALVDGKEPIPLLDDLIAAFPDARINIDCKTDAAVDGLMAVLRRTASMARVCVGAFGTKRLGRIRAQAGEQLCTAMSTAEVFRWRIGSWIPGGWPTPDVPCAQVPVRARGLSIVTRKTFETAHRRGIAVHVWTIDDVDEMQRLLDLGVDGIMTDRPSVLKDVLVARGQWV
jgi:glycerophosphoryl diester phosphodiesterase